MRWAVFLTIARGKLSSVEVNSKFYLGLPTATSIESMLGHSLSLVGVVLLAAPVLVVGGFVVDISIGILLS